jgi:uncharacterized protein YceK
MVRFRKTTLCLLMLVLMLAATLSGCGSYQEAIIGTWELNSGSETIVFHADQTFSQTTEAGETVDGTYQFTDDSHIELTIPTDENEVGKLLFEVDIRGAQMTLTDQSGGAGRVGLYTRVRR